MIRNSLRLLCGAALVAPFLTGVQVFAQDKQKQDDAEMFQRLQTFADALSAIRTYYVEETDDEDLIANALNGALEGLDPHSHYVPHEEHTIRQNSAHRVYGGLGIEVSLENELIKIDYLIPNGPAAKAGLKRNDFITAVGGTKIKGKSLTDAVSGMRGLAGEPVTVTVLRGSKPEFDVEVIREDVKGRVVRPRIEEGLAYIRIETFNHPRLSDDLTFALNELKSDLGGNIPGLIIDVRGNPGGLVDQTVEVAGHFLDGGEVFSAKGRRAADTQRYNASVGEDFEGVPIVVLINSRSASAAEILAGAIQDRGRGLVVGRRSFGKGSVQSVITMPGEVGSLRLTTQRYYTPSGRSIQGRGIMPDKLVAARPETEYKRSFYREDSFENALQNPDETDYKENPDTVDYPPEDWPRTRDYQLEEAVKLIKSQNYKKLLAEQFGE